MKARARDGDCDYCVQHMRYELPMIKDVLKELEVRLARATCPGFLQGIRKEVVAMEEFQQDLGETLVPTPSVPIRYLRAWEVHLSSSETVRLCATRKIRSELLESQGTVTFEIKSSPNASQQEQFMLELSPKALAVLWARVESEIKKLGEPQRSRGLQFFTDFMNK